MDRRKSAYFYSVALVIIERRRTASDRWRERRGNAACVNDVKKITRCLHNDLLVHC